MCKAWVGFNFSHSMGALVFGTLCVCTATLLGTVAIPAWVLLLIVVIALIYLGLSVLYRFRIPTAGIAIALVCLLGAWLIYMFARV
jgi:hypothetical protein